uniref:Uncharacterized protein n=1 Tax=Solanum lycopersicum TaxID=4081 RepID=A0A3Q7EF06_SOLLC
DLYKEIFGLHDPAFISWLIDDLIVNLKVIKILR